MRYKNCGQYVMDCHKMLGYLCLKQKDQMTILLSFATPYNIGSLFVG